MDEGSIWLRLRGKPLYLLLAATLFAVALWSFWPRALPVESAAIAAAPLTESFSEEGRTRLRSRYQLGAPLDGTVERIVAEPGDAVAAGDWGGETPLHGRVRRIELGRIGDGRAEVRGGLREGDRVVLFPADTVRDGRRITAQSP